MLPLIPGTVIVLIGLAVERRSNWLVLLLIAAAGVYVFVRVWTLDRASVRAHERDLDGLDRLEDR